MMLYGSLKIAQTSKKVKKKCFLACNLYNSITIELHTYYNNIIIICFIDSENEVQPEQLDDFIMSQNLNWSFDETNMIFEKEINFSGSKWSVEKQKDDLPIISGALLKDKCHEDLSQSHVKILDFNDKNTEDNETLIKKDIQGTY